MWEIGVDVVEVQRFRMLVYTKYKHFYERIFTPREIEYCLSSKNQAQHFAATFAGKESVYKAINGRVKIKLREIEIIREGDVPKVNLASKGNQRSGEAGSQVKVKVSLSHTSSHAVAFALAMFEGSE